MALHHSTSWFSVRVFFIMFMVLCTHLTLSMVYPLELSILSSDAVCSSFCLFKFLANERGAPEIAHLRSCFMNNSHASSMEMLIDKPLNLASRFRRTQKAPLISPQPRQYVAFFLRHPQDFVFPLTSERPSMVLVFPQSHLHNQRVRFFLPLGGDSPITVSLLNFLPIRSSRLCTAIHCPT